MKINRLSLTNFNGFEHVELTFNPSFNLLVGDNASGKTSILDALSIAADSWLLGIDSGEKPTGIDQRQVRVATYIYGDEFRFEKQFPTRIEARGIVQDIIVTWVRELVSEKGRTGSSGAKNLISIADDTRRRVRDGEDITLPLICSYGTERLWYETPHLKRKQPAKHSSRPSRFDGYRDCNVFEIQETALLDWIKRESSAGRARERNTVGFEAIREAIFQCVEGATDVYYDERYDDLVVGFGTAKQELFGNLSDGQRIMLTFIGDIVKRAVTLNPHLGSSVLKETPGIVMIDELDLHLHPKWQRRVMQDLKSTFPSLQFIATTHSPQLVGEAKPDEIRVLNRGSVTVPEHSYGLDSSRVLEEVMGASPRTKKVDESLSQIARLLDNEKYPEARLALSDLAATLGEDDPEVTRVDTMLKFLEPSYASNQEGA